MLSHLAPLAITHLADLLAVALLVAVSLGLGWMIEHPPASRPSVTVLMEEYRRIWMREFVTRNPRIFDGTIIESLRQATAFFASACLIALGGGIALIGNADRLEMVAQDLALLTAGLPVEMKIALSLIYLADALMKFIWANRLFGYCAILMAAVPNDPANPACLPTAARAAEVNINAGRNFNRGLRSIYYALATLAWLAGPWALMIAVVAVALLQVRREFTSDSRRVLMSGG